MIARTWSGKTRSRDAERYLEYLHETGLREIGSTPGNRGVWVLRRLDGGEAEFLLISLWDSIDSIRAFTGPSPEKARYYPEDDAFLLGKSENVDHFEIAFSSDAR